MDYTLPLRLYTSRKVAQPSIRGVLLMSITVASNVGVLFIHLLSGHIKWKIGALLSVTVLIPVSIYILYLPESPIFLMKTGSNEDARRVFFQLRGISDISKKEFEKITEKERELNKSQGLSFVALMYSLSNPIFWKPLLIVFAAMFTVQLTGYSAMISYAIEELQDFGLNYEYSAMITIDIFRVAATMFSCILVQKMTRRRLAMLSGYGSSVTLFCLWFYLYISPRYNVKLPLVVMVLLIINICFIHMGLNPLAYALMGELFPMDNKSMGAAISSIFCYTLYYLVVLSYPYLRVLFSGIAEIFLGYSACVLFGTICLTLFLPETKDKPFYMIEEYFKSRK
ncbi:hypothetical protein WA026_016816 [Henosepilachna vigintioctopunctata]|uniref:Major facilitator superfamily (MFS) profile domain-containing protein n=1 Tax=Henosepilachna vigintioctopunctata TaxID=420089 RepID=A0AAW1UVM4_9CUCU